VKVALFFGSFNPIHVGHLILAQNVLNETDCRQVWLVVSPHNPHKDKKSLLNAHDRLRLCELALEDRFDIRPTNIEFSLPQPSYTIDTLKALNQRHPGAEFRLLMGGDNLATLHKWKEYRTIVENYPIIVYPRLGTEPPPANYPNVRMLSGPMLEISATQIRELISAGKSVKYMVPERALDYILSRGLYRR
jgi:nicotinate-nucleotide adenylyltransferase